MGLFDIFSTSFLITIGITVLALCLMFLYFSQKFAEQDHKISSMVDLVTTMAQEIHMLKIQCQQPEAQYPSDLATNGGSTLVTKRENQLIEVSDDEEDEEEEYESESDSDNDNEEVDDESINDDNSSQAEPLTLEEEINLDDIQELEEKENEEIKNVSITLDTLDEIKGISLEEEQDVHQVDTDYKKMSVDKLRHIVVEKGLVVDASKLKKKELLKLLGLSE